ncbi:MAG: LCCL domain-containing protein, partial [Myxococcota bacterium]|nr:LCCL domain-containing protein [Myxococcota bacterium]
PAKQEKIITEIRARYGFDEDSYKSAAELVGEKSNVKFALEAKMKDCTETAAESFLKAGAGAAAVEGGCPDRFRSVENFKAGEAIEVTCKCTKEAAESGPLWGTGTYTTDSSICKAAVHAGVIKAEEGGEVTVKGMEGCETYTGTEANGLTSSNWGSYQGSFFFPSAGEAKCGATEETPDEKKPEVKKPVRKYTTGKYVSRGLRVGDISAGEVVLQFTDDGKVKGFFKGKREGKFFNMPLSGSISASSGQFNARGKSGRNTASVSGGANKNSATGNISGSINSKGFKIRFTAKR